MATLDELETSFATILDKVSPSVVRLGGWRGGAGVVVGSGAVLTNAHNVRGDSTTVTFADGHQAQASLGRLVVDVADVVVRRAFHANGFVRMLDRLQRLVIRFRVFLPIEVYR